MPANLSEYEVLSRNVCLEHVQPSPLSPNFHLAGGSASDPQSAQVTGNWQKRENTERPESDEDVELHQLMEDIKRYIRSIDIGNL